MTQHRSFMELTNSSGITTRRAQLCPRNHSVQNEEGVLQPSDWRKTALRQSRCTLGLLAVLAVLAHGSAAQVTTDRPASILFFPKINVDATHDTLVQMTNGTNPARHARCFYIGAAGVCSS